MSTPPPNALTVEQAHAEIARRSKDAHWTPIARHAFDMALWAERNGSADPTRLYGYRDGCLAILARCTGPGWHWLDVVRAVEIATREEEQ